MTGELPTVMNQGANQVQSLVKTYAPPLVGLAIGYAAGDMLGVGSLSESLLKKYTSMDAGSADKLASVITLSVYLGGFAALRGKGMVSNTMAWACLGVSLKEIMSLRKVLT